MTRHKIDAKNPKHEVFVGWDRKHWSFYGEVYDLAFPEAQRLIFAPGTERPRMYRDLDGIMYALRDYAYFPPSILLTLYGDQKCRK